ncbi:MULTISPECIES: ABC transporter permease subunit [unclassified Exiguobacterium]|uniref:ABC transporter permease subunit n=1 Tax=unclassified Exiguobacterium TaxID=2644629 RepID=UPI001BEC21D6|nr:MULTISPECIES: ABC transporter permease subunit [unclassified Exiguobacterium]
MLIRSMFRQNRSWILGYSIGTSIYLFFLAAIFPSIQETGLIEAKLESLPPELLDVFQIDATMAMDNLLNLLSSNYYGLIFYVLAVLFALTFASKLLAKPVDSGEIMLYMAAPISRVTYVLSTFVILIIAVSFFVGLNGLSLMAADVLFDLQIDYSVLWMLQLNGALMLLVLGVVAYMLASLFDDSSKSYIVTGGIFTFFLMVNIINGVSEQFEWLGNISFFSLFDAPAIMREEFGGIHFIWLIGLLMFFSVLSFIRFIRKDLTI